MHSEFQVLTCQSEEDCVKPHFSPKKYSLGRVYVKIICYKGGDPILGLAFSNRLLLHFEKRAFQLREVFLFYHIP